MIQKDLDLAKRWEKLLLQLEQMVGKKPKELSAVLFLIGIQELGQGNRRFNKEEKQDLLHIAICKVLSYAGYYELEGLDQDGWPQWKLKEKLPKFDLLEQEQLLKEHILAYFEQEYDLLLD